MFLMCIAEQHRYPYVLLIDFNIAAIIIHPLILDSRSRQSSISKRRVEREREGAD